MKMNLKVLVSILVAVVIGGSLLGCSALQTETGQLIGPEVMRIAVSEAIVQRDAPGSNAVCERADKSARVVDAVNSLFDDTPVLVDELVDRVRSKLVDNDVSPVATASLTTLTALVAQNYTEKIRQGIMDADTQIDISQYLTVASDVTDYYLDGC